MLINKIKDKVKEVLDFNLIRVKDIIVTEKEVLDYDRMKKVFSYSVKILFNKQIVLFDNYLVLYYTFALRFKVFRSYVNTKDNSFNFTLIMRDLRTIHKILDEV